MQTSNLNQLYRILNAWFLFIALLIISTVFPHWKGITFLSWINEAVYYVLFLMAISVASKDRNNRDIFINMSVFFFFYSISFLNLFIGKGYLFGSDHLAFYIYAYKQILFSFLTNFLIVYIVLKYLFTRNRIILYPLTFLITVLILIANFRPYLIDLNHVFHLGNTYMTDISYKLFTNEMFSIFFLIAFGYRLYKKDIILGEYINALMSFLFVYLIISLVNSLSIVYNFQIFTVSQCFLTISLILLFIVLFKKLCFLCTEYGQFYENLLHGHFSIGHLRIQRRHYKSNSLMLKILKIYFYQRFNAVITILWLSAILFFYFHFPTFFTVNAAAFCVCLIILFNFFNALYKKRERQGHIITDIAKADS